MAAAWQCDFCNLATRVTCLVCSRSACHVHARQQRGYGLVCHACYRPSSCSRESGDPVEEDKEQVLDATVAAEPAAAETAVDAVDAAAAELCQFCIRRARRTCYRCNVALCGRHAVGGYWFGLYTRAALCRTCSELWSDSPESDDYETESTSDEERDAGNMGQMTVSLMDNRSGGAAAVGSGERPAQSTTQGEAEARLGAPSSTRAAGENGGGDACGARTDHETNHAAVLPQDHDPKERIQVASSSDGSNPWLLMELLRDERTQDEEAPNPSTPRWDRWGECQRRWRWELDLDTCSSCHKSVCPEYCWPGVGTQCWDCIPHVPQPALA